MGFVRSHAWLRVRRLGTYSNQGTQEETSVFCPRQGRSLPLEACLRCDHCDGVRVSASGRNRYLRCRGVPVDDGAAPFAEDRHEEPTAAAWTPVARVMTHDMVAVTRDLSLPALMTLFLERHISGAPVVDEDGRIVGMVSKSDLVRAQLEDEEKRESIDKDAWGPMRSLEVSPEVVVSDIMTPLAFAVTERASVAQAAALMAYEGIHHVPVVDDDGAPVGILSSLDVMRFLAEHDGFLEPDGPSGG